jgi:hypothetical protein
MREWYAIIKNIKDGQYTIILAKLTGKTVSSTIDYAQTAGIQTQSISWVRLAEVPRYPMDSMRPLPN